MLKGIKRIHFVGIGGYGMSALAYVFLEAGYYVSGSDLKSSSLTEALEKMGAEIFLGHSREHVQDSDMVVYSTAIPSDNPELEEARAKGLPLWHRSLVLASLLNEKYGIAVAGTHGKTTTTAMISLLLEHAGLEPTSLIGGEVSFYHGNACLGKSDYVVAEACESDYSFLQYKPNIAVLTNIEPDHLEYYEGSFHKQVEGYLGFVNNIKKDGTVIYYGDDPVISSLKDRVQPDKISYGFSEDVDLRAVDIELEGLSSSFKLVYRGEELGQVVLKVPGLHNVLNSLAAAAVALKLNVAFETIKEAFCSFNGAKRRFEVLGEEQGILVVDDYAHHPTEIRETLRTGRQGGRRVVCIFQPHRYTRIQYLWKEFIEAFDSADVVILTEIYSAGEPTLPGVSSRLLGEEVKKRKKSQVYLVGEKEEVMPVLGKVASRGDLVITMGAGDIWEVGKKFLQGLSQGNFNGARSL